MKQQSQILNYLQWSSERGLVWPVLTSNCPQSLIANDEVDCKCGTAVFPDRRISLLTLYPDGTDVLMTTESRQLLDKMCAATKIPQSDFNKVALKCCASAGVDGVKVRFQTLLAKKPTFILVLGEETAAALESLGVCLDQGVPQDHDGVTLLFTHHPEELLTDPKKKISAWQHLQTMMHLLKN